MTGVDPDKDLAKDCETKRQKLIETTVAKFEDVQTATEELASRINEQLRNSKDEQGVYSPFVCKYVPDLRNLVYVSQSDGCSETHLKQVIDTH